MIKHLKKARHKTTLSWHNALRRHSVLYDHWHKYPYHRHFHVAIFAIFLIKLLVVFGLYFGAAGPSLAQEAGGQEAGAGQSQGGLPEFVLEMKDAKGISKPGKMELFDSQTGELIVSGRGGEKVSKNKDKILKVKYTPDSSSAVTSIEFDGADLTGSSQAEIPLDEPPVPPGWEKMVAVGKVKGFKFTKGKFKKIAQGNKLFKCVDWDFAAQTCTGRWKKAADLVPGQEYTVDFTPADPGWGEKNKKVYLLDKKDNLLEYSETEISTDDIVVVPLGDLTFPTPPFEELEIIDLDLTSDSNEAVIDPVADSLAQETFLVDTSNLKVKSAKIKKLAKGRASLECSSFDDAAGTCRKWKKERSLTPDQNYDISLSPGKSVWGQSRDGVLVLDEDLEVVATSNETIVKSGSSSYISTQFIDLNPHKITTYYDADTDYDEVRINANTLVTTATGLGKYIAFDMSTMDAVEADVDAIAEGYDLFRCEDFDFENQKCLGKRKKVKDLSVGNTYQFKVIKDKNIRSFFESKKKITLLGQEDDLLDYEEHIVVEEAGVGEYELDLPEGPIGKIRVKNHTVGNSNDLKIDTTVTAEPDAVQSYAVDPTGLQAESTELDITAKGNTLYKCKGWDFATETCNGEWVKVKSITPGSTYTLAVDSTDPGFMETMEEEPSPTPSPSSSGGGGGSAVLLPTLQMTQTEETEEQKNIETEEPAEEESETEEEPLPLPEGEMSKAEGEGEISDNQLTDEEAPPLSLRDISLSEEGEKEESEEQAPDVDIGVDQSESGLIGMLAIGSRGEEVFNLQKDLVVLGFDPGPIDGIFGPLTCGALKRFQSANNLAADCIFGPKTNAVLIIRRTDVEPERRTDAEVSDVDQYPFTRNLGYGDYGKDVRALQKLLNQLGFIVSSVGAGSPGNETKEFGEKTRQALRRFQEAFSSEILEPFGLMSGTGYFGPRSRAKANELIISNSPNSPNF